MKSKHNSRAFAKILGTQYLILPFTVLTGILVARVLGPEDRGIYGFALLVINLISPLVLMGNQTSVNYFIASKKYQTKDIFFTILLIGLFFGLISSFIIYTLWSFKYLGTTGNQLTYRQILMCVSLIPFATIYFLTSRIIRAEGWYNYVNAIDIIYPLCSILCLWILVVGLGYGINGGIIAIGTVQIILCLFTLIIILKKTKPKGNISVSFTKDSMRYGIKSWLGTLATLTNSKLDHIFVSGFAQASHFAFYSIAVSLAGLIEKIPMALSTIFFNRIAEQKDLETRIKITEQIHRVTYVLIYVLGVGLMIIGPLIIPLFYGEAYKGAIIPFLIYTPVIMIYTTTRIIIYYFSSSGKPIVSSNIQLFALIAAIPCYYYFASNYGAVGAAFANIIVTVVSLSVALRYWLKQSGTSLKELFVLTSKDIDFVKQQFRKISKK